jgi:hypothetical protein
LTIRCGCYLKVARNGYDDIGLKGVYKMYANDSSYTQFKFHNFESIVKLFVNTLFHDSELAMAYVSKKFVESINLEDIKSFILPNRYKYLNGDIVTNNIRKKTLLAFNENRENGVFVHIYLLNEPNSFGKWKIYKINKEHFK